MSISLTMSMGSRCSNRLWVAAAASAFSPATTASSSVRVPEVLVGEAEVPAVVVMEVDTVALP